MKINVLVLVGFLTCVAGEVSTAREAQNRSERTKIIGGVSDGKPSPPAPPEVLPKFKINWSVVHQKKGHKVIINKVQAPARVFQHSAEPLSEEEVTRRHDEVKKRIGEIKGSGGFYTVSATIYDHKTTYVRLLNEDGEFAFYSNVDWNHLKGFHEFEGRGKRYNMLMFSGNVSMKQLQKDIKAGYRNTLPNIPKLPHLSKRGAAYMVVKGDENNDAAMEFIEAIHDLYDEHRPALVKAWHEREKNHRIYLKNQEALRLNPPPKKDVVINLWENNTGDKNQPKGKEAK